MPYERQRGLAELNTSGYCSTCFGVWSNFLDCMEGLAEASGDAKCRWVEFDDMPRIDYGEFEMGSGQSRANSRAASGYAFGDLQRFDAPKPASAPAIPAGFGPSPQPASSDAVSVELSGPPTADSPSVGTPPHAGPAGFAPGPVMVDAWTLAQAFRSAARECDFDDSDRATRLINVAREIDETGSALVPYDDPSRY